MRREVRVLLVAWREVVRLGLVLLAVGAARVAAWARYRLHCRPDALAYWPRFVRSPRLGGARTSRQRGAKSLADEATEAVPGGSAIDSVVRARGSWFPGDL